MYTGENKVARFTFRTPTETNNWRYVADLRKAAANAETFDRELELNINLYTPQPEIDYPDIDVVWRKFQNIFDTVKEAIRYFPVFVDYHTQMLQEMVDDNIMYAEIRTGVPELYDRDGRVYTVVETVQILKDLTDAFRVKNPRFLGLKLIYASHRKIDPRSYDDINVFRMLQAMFPNFVIGYDIVGQETAADPNSMFAEQISALAGDTRFFFHAGETSE